MAAAISIEEYRGYRDQYLGFCTKCKEWTADSVEPDAQEYVCPVCGEQAVYGAEEALLQGRLEVE